MESSNPKCSMIVFVILLLTGILIIYFISESSVNYNINGQIATNSEESHKILTLLETISSKLDAKSVGNPGKVCKTPECIHLAHRLHSWGDKNVNPCDDFYQSVCGRFSEFVDSKSGQWEFHRNLHAIEEHLKKTQKMNNDSVSENTLRELFTRCEDRQKNGISDENDKKSLKDLFVDIQKIGGWPMIEEDWNDNQFNLNDYLENMARLGIHDYGLFYVETKPKRIIFTPSEDNVNVKYLEMMIPAIMSANGITPNNQKIQEELKKAKQFEQDLQKMFLENKNLKSEENNQSETEFTSLFNLKQIVMAHFPSESSTQWENIEKYINNRKFEKFHGLKKLLNSTSSRTQANFLIFQIIQNSFPSLNSSRSCGRLATQFLPQTTVQVFLRNFFNRDNIKDVSDLIDEIKGSLVDIFNNSTWLHEETRAKAIRKLQNINKIVGYTEEFEKPDELDLMFKKFLKTSPNDTFYKFIQKLKRFQVEQQAESVLNLNQSESNEKLLMSNAYYSPNNNLIKVVLGFMDDPHFDTSFPKYAKLAYLGDIIGHEFGHAFDTGGRKMDENGKEVDWWHPEDSKEYDKRTDCMKKVYDDYDDPSYGTVLKASSRKIKEIIADFTGSNIVWNLFKNNEKMSEEPSLVGFEDEPLDKMFFRISALKFCRGFETLPIKSALKASHPQKNFRVNGILANKKEFAKAFNCPVGSKMNPKDKCDEIFA